MRDRCEHGVLHNGEFRCPDCGAAPITDATSADVRLASWAAWVQGVLGHAVEGEVEMRRALAEKFILILPEKQPAPLRDV